ncbi:MAG: hypothetical protein IH991_20995 [Planctomycetes bacterium]|nr:hypothetical protein [Planctomycetota bacterium]
MTAASVFLAFVIGLAFSVYLVYEDYPALVFLLFILPMVIGVTVLLPSGIFSLVAFFYLRRPSVKQQFGDSQRPFETKKKRVS